MRYPEFLKAQGTIGFVAPSFGCAREPYKSGFVNAQKKFHELGHSLWLGPNVYAGKGLGISNTPQACAAEFMEGYTTQENDVLISCGGGELMCEILDYLDWDQIRKASPKWFQGYSDNTNLTFLLATLCDTAALYAPCAAAFGMEPWHPAIADSYQTLTGKKQTVTGYDLFERESLKDEEHPLLPYNVTEPRRIHAFPEKKTAFEGRLIGGCLDSLINLCGTKYDHVAEFTEKYKEEGILWFLESCDLNVLSIRRAIWQLKHAGWFDGARGFLIGRPYCHGQEIMGLDQYDAVMAHLGDLDVPVLMDLDIGHVAPMMSLIVGSHARVSYDDQNFSMTMELK